MRRFAWLGITVVLLALWAWQQRPHASVSAGAGNDVSMQSQSVPPRGSPDQETRDQRTQDQGTHDQASRWPGFLPLQALDTLRKIERGGPFDHRQDGSTFQNRERLLPTQPPGYYREYTVTTLGSRDRGARRIVSGGGVPGQSPPTEYFYSDDHYRSFQRFVLSSQSADDTGLDQ